MTYFLRIILEFKINQKKNHKRMNALLCQHRISLVAQMVKRLSPVQETRVRSLVWEDLLEKEMATHSSILAWRIPWTEEPVKLYSPCGHRVRYN